MKKLVLAISVLCFGLLTSCVSTQDVPLSNGNIFQQKQAVTAKREKPIFAAMTPGKAGFGMIGAAAMISSGNKIVRENNVEDPANWISKELATSIQKKYGTRFQGSRNVMNESPAVIAKTCSDVDYVLDVRTINWSFVYFPVNWGTYRVMYSSKVRLIDCKTGKVIAQGFHARVPDKSPQSPSYDDLVDHQATGLKRELQIGAAECLNHFKHNILKL
jgi:hypothetical protein